mmetsp:Transcript_29868/g.45809  ORF Transcript_29868/g.45809 Transcript_29868/m.45809 type:complete len:201 (+) Transcript_29868:70-672(+)
MNSTLDSESPNIRTMELFDDEYFDDHYDREITDSKDFTGSVKRKFSVKRAGGVRSNKSHEWCDGTNANNDAYHPQQISNRTPVFAFKALIDSVSTSVQKRTIAMLDDKGRRNHQMSPSPKDHKFSIGDIKERGKRKTKSRRKPSQIHPNSYGKKTSLISKAWTNFTMMYKISPQTSHHSTKSFHASPNVDSMRRGWHAGM